MVWVRVHDDAQVPPEHVPRGYRHAGPGAAEEVRRETRTRRQLLLHAGRRGTLLLITSYLESSYYRFVLTY